jgi:hypothetical protein
MVVEVVSASSPFGGIHDRRAAVACGFYFRGIRIVDPPLRGPMDTPGKGKPNSKSTAAETGKG